LVKLSELMTRFRIMPLLHQAVIAGILFFLLYSIFNKFVMGMTLMLSLETSFYSSILFMAVYYFTSVLIMRKNLQGGTIKGPKKGRRKS
jgi:hypothetical protein